jgi:hypothetical protein
MAIILKNDTWLKQKQEEFAKNAKPLLVRNRVISPLWQFLIIPLYFYIPIYASAAIAILLYFASRDWGSLERLTKHRQLCKAQWRYTLGLYGEDLVSAELAKLPDDTYVLHDITIDSRQIDHVIVAPNAIVAVETKNRSGRIVAAENLWYHNGIPYPSAQNQAIRNAQALARFIEKPVYPVVALVNAEFFGPGPCHVVRPEGIAQFLQSLKPHVNYSPPEVAYRILNTAK